jgi:hypothetical protein
VAPAGTHKSGCFRLLLALVARLPAARLLLPLRRLLLLLLLLLRGPCGRQRHDRLAHHPGVLRGRVLLAATARLRRRGGWLRQRLLFWHWRGAAAGGAARGLGQGAVRVR